MPHVRIANGNLNMYYEDIGVGEPIVFIHGSFSRGIVAFAAQVQAFQLTNRAIYPDLRGHGYTAGNSGQWTSPQLADDVVCLMDALQIEKAHVVGHSMGGDVAMYCAMNHPARFCSITSIGSGGSVNESVTGYMERYNPQSIDMGKYGQFIEVLKKDHHPAHLGDWQSFLEQTIFNCNAYPVFSDEDLKKIRMPFLLIHGSRDWMVKQDEMDRLARNVPNLCLRRIEGAGHFPHIASQNCNEVNQAILEFIR